MKYEKFSSSVSSAVFQVFSLHRWLVATTRMAQSKNVSVPSKVLLMGAALERCVSHAAFICRYSKQVLHVYGKEVCACTHRSTYLYLGKWRTIQERIKILIIMERGGRERRHKGRGRELGDSESALVCKSGLCTWVNALHKYNKNRTIAPFIPLTFLDAFFF